MRRQGLLLQVLGDREGLTVGGDIAAAGIQGGSAGRPRHRAAAPSGQTGVQVGIALPVRVTSSHSRTGSLPGGENRLLER